MDESYHELFNLHAQLYKVLSNPKRLEIINCLRDYDLTVSELKNMLGWRQANISQHLAILRQLGLVKAKRNGLNIHYSLTDKKIIEAYDVMRNILFAKTVGGGGDTILKITKDPVCGMHVSAFSASEKEIYQGKTYYFCGRGCLRKFTKEPKGYL